MISAYEIETAVLSEIGAGPGLSTKEQQGFVPKAVRLVIYEAAAGKVKIDLIKQPDGAAGDEAASTAPHQMAPGRTSARRIP